jgi:hypothetical protein
LNTALEVLASAIRQEKHVKCTDWEKRKKIQSFDGIIIYAENPK